MAERLGNGLQNRVQRFDSAWDLTKIRLCQQKIDTAFVFLTISRSKKNEIENYRADSVHLPRLSGDS